MKFVAALISAVAAQQVDKVTSDPVYNCKAPFVLNGKECVNFIQDEPILTCRPGTIRNGDMCISETPKVTRCPAGSTEQGKQCVIIENAQPITQCPRPYEQQADVCVMQVPLPMTETCEIGSREGPDCVKYETAPHNTTSSCPAGYQEHNGKGCYKTVQYDCTPLGQGKGGSSLRGLAGSQQPVNPKFDIPKQTCERKEAAPMQVIKECPLGYTENTATGVCSRREIFPTTKVCNNGAPIEQCFTTKQTAPETECPAGYISEGNSCIKYSYAEQESFCTMGMDNGRACETSEPVKVSCPAGLTLEGNICVGKEVSQPIVTVVTTCSGKDCYAK